MNVPVPQVTVVTAVFNGARYLGEAIESVLSQGVPLRYIVVDDGSTDATATILAEFGARIGVIRQANSGQSVALNVGLRLVNTPWVAFNDADDLWEPVKLAVQLATAQAHSDAAIIVGQCVEFASGDALDPSFGWTVRQAVTPGFGSGGILVKSDLIERLNGFDEALIYGGFVDLLARAEEAGAKSVVHDHVVFRRRIHGGNLSMSTARARQDYLAIARARLLRRRKT
jgi:glycosyltransferase involved in cell wall biosynthesis